MKITLRFDPEISESPPPSLFWLQSVIDKLYNAPAEAWEPLAVAAQLAYCQYMSV